MASIVIPAHDEAGSIERLLIALAPLSSDTEIAVVCNGCTDDTAVRARKIAPWATIIELETASKPLSLNVGDAAVTSFPRAYIDADVYIDADAVRKLFTSVHDNVQAVGATPIYDLSRSSLLVRSHYAIWCRMMANHSGIDATYAMAISAEGRGRFRSWPEWIGDDYFLDGQFSSSEKRRVEEAAIVNTAPRGIYDCISRKARAHQGNIDVVREGLRSAHSGGGAAGALAVVRSHPQLAIHLPTHVLITLSARWLVRWRKWRGRSQYWYRDRSRAIGNLREVADSGQAAGSCGIKPVVELVNLISFTGGRFAAVSSRSVTCSPFCGPSPISRATASW